MKHTFTLLIALLFIAGAANAQKDKSERASPPAEISQEINGNLITINYSKPNVKGRTIWGGLVKYNKVWRTGANEATWVSFSKDCKINGNDVKAGKYALFTIPTEEKWTVILNTKWDQWGAYSYSDKNDVLRFDTETKTIKSTESLTFDISEAGMVTFAWEKLEFSFDVK